MFATAVSMRVKQCSWYLQCLRLQSRPAVLSRRAGQLIRVPCRPRASRYHSSSSGKAPQIGEFLGRQAVDFPLDSELWKGANSATVTHGVRCASKPRGPVWIWFRIDSEQIWKWLSGGGCFRTIEAVPIYTAFSRRCDLATGSIEHEKAKAHIPEKTSGFI